MNYNVGDTVTIKENAWNIDHPRINFAAPMKKFCSGTYVVREIIDNCYKLEDVKSDDSYMNYDGYWKWVEEWIEESSDLPDVNESEIMSLFN